jgi:hypothetical protein
MSFKEDYKKKLVTAEEAVGVVKSGDWVDYGHFPVHRHIWILYWPGALMS